MVGLVVVHLVGGSGRGRGRPPSDMADDESVSEGAIRDAGGAGIDEAECTTNGEAAAPANACSHVMRACGLAKRSIARPSAATDSNRSDGDTRIARRITSS